MTQPPITENHNYKNGLLMGSKIIKFIDHTTYKTLHNALAAKSELSQLLSEKLGYTEANKEYAENLGIIAALELEIQKHEYYNPFRTDESV